MCAYMCVGKHSQWLKPCLLQVQVCVYVRTGIANGLSLASCKCVCVRTGVANGFSLTSCKCKRTRVCMCVTYKLDRHVVLHTHTLF